MFCEECSFADLRLQRKSDSAFDVTTSHTGGRTLSLDADVASKVGSAGWELGLLVRQLLHNGWQRLNRRHTIW